MDTSSVSKFGVLFNLVLSHFVSKHFVVSEVHINGLLQTVTMDIQTFGYKIPGAHKEFVAKGYTIIDCRVLPNPWRQPELRELQGTDPRVFAFLQSTAPDIVEELLNEAFVAINANSTKIAFGCYGGKHRSVAMAQVFLHRMNPTLLD